ncbi:uncharacterized protein B0J16DRAFT_325632 [Fusarium flagelliforme]|uniref:Chaperone protein dnaj n=1 Tax=Fusarium flagelliforme TaxID=2675880 RepID=A0A395MG04_9HYPO|nr:uncharacterized protein B0J16DRAFT_325632 [Fusarium flagelliforme]KAH7169763.1 hypothetical protein B0J16DRAFT_325632 [Fusarium flagelliforme]RFN46049.1 chaperone protein dnaj [Fusarium flagelliforme]
MAYEHIDWCLSEVVDPKYIAAVRTLIEDNYPRREPKSSKPPYPKEHLGSGSVSFYSWRKNEEKMLHRYNPFCFRIPYNLTALSNLFQYDYTRRLNPYGLNITPAEERLNFLREYHLLYADILEVLNGDGIAKSRLQTKIYTDSMYQSAGIQARHLNIPSMESVQITFRLSLLAHLALDIVRSEEEAISTAARVKVLKMLYDFDIDSVATAFSNYNKGFLLHEREFVEDLIPGSFIKHVTEKGGTPHNDLFMRNTTIQSIFRMRPLYGEIDFDAGLSTLLHRYQAETVQVLLSFLRLNVAVVPLPNKHCAWANDYEKRNRESTKLVFHSLVQLSQLDCIQKRELFGVKASYRTSTKNARPSSFQSRIGATTGVEGGACDELESLSKESLIALVRQQRAYIERLEELPPVLTTKPSTAPSFNDPKGYFKIFGLDPRTLENIDEILNPYYRALALKWYPDKNGDDPEKTEKFKKLQTAYEILSDPEQRNRYLASGHSQSR